MKILLVGYKLWNIKLDTILSGEGRRPQDGLSEMRVRPAGFPKEA